MPLPLTDRHRFSPARRFCCLLFVLICQLTWILPSAFFFLLQTSTPRILILHDRNISRSLQAKAFAGPVKVFGTKELNLIQTIHEEWTRFWPGMKEKLVAKGFVEPPSRTCFMWLPQCHTLAKNSKILEIVTEAIGPNVLLYGVSSWQGKSSELLRRFHRDPEALGCERSLSFVTGTSLQLISLSHKLPERLFQAILRNLQAVEEESLSIRDEQEQVGFLVRSFASKVKRMVRTPDIRLEILQANDGYGIFFQGSTIYRLGEAPLGGTTLLLQFISADCKVRDARNFGWGSQQMQAIMYMPPVLLLSGDGATVGATNDVHLSLLPDQTVGTKIVNREHSVLGDVAEDLGVWNMNVSHVSNVTVFSGSKSSVAWKDMGIWNSVDIGEVSTDVVARGKIDHFLLKQMVPSLEFGRVRGEEEQVVVVLREGILYFRAISDSELSFCELLELKPGSAVVFSKKLHHALVPLGPETAFISFRWLGYERSRSLGEPLLVNKSYGYSFTAATEGRTVLLSSGQAYDPDNDENCDVLIFIVEGYLLQVLPSNFTLGAPDVLLIPAGQSCVLWNIGGLSVKFFAMHLCRFKDGTVISTSFGASGKIF